VAVWGAGSRFYVFVWWDHIDASVMGSVRQMVIPGQGGVGSTLTRQARRRANTLMTSRDALIKELVGRGWNASSTRYSPWGVSVELPQDDYRIFDQVRGLTPRGSAPCRRLLLPRTNSPAGVPGGRSDG
jgi:hypothetical protein